MEFWSARGEGYSLKKVVRKSLLEKDVTEGGRLCLGEEPPGHRDWRGKAQGRRRLGEHEHEHQPEAVGLQGREPGQTSWGYCQRGTLRPDQEGPPRPL